MVDYFELLMDIWSLIKQTNHKQQKLDDAAKQLIQSFHNANVDSEDIKDVLYEDDKSLVDAYKDIYGSEEDEPDTDDDDDYEDYQ